MNPATNLAAITARLEQRQATMPRHPGLDRNVRARDYLRAIDEQNALLKAQAKASIEVLRSGGHVPWLTVP